nr:unnamed protein product [Callosobruchus chinensis]
MAQLHMEVC